MRRNLRAYLSFPPHLYRIWRAGQLRFRLETFGLYYPSPPYAAPWWRIRPRNAWLLLRQTPSYVTWLQELEEVRGSPESWWQARGVGTLDQIGND